MTNAQSVKARLKNQAEKVDGLYPEEKGDERGEF